LEGQPVRAPSSQTPRPLAPLRTRPGSARAVSEFAAGGRHPAVGTSASSPHGRKLSPAAPAWLVRPPFARASAKVRVRTFRPARVTSPPSARRHPPLRACPPPPPPHTSTHAHVGTRRQTRARTHTRLSPVAFVVNERHMPFIRFNECILFNKLMECHVVDVCRSVTVGPQAGPPRHAIPQRSQAVTLFSFSAGRTLPTPNTHTPQPTPSSR